MKKKYKFMLFVIYVLMVITAFVSVSYAYFTATIKGNEDASSNVITTGVMALEFTDGDQVSLNNAVPGTSVEKTFKVKNTGNLETTYDLYFSEILNELEDKNDLVYTLSSETGCSVLEDTVVPSVVGEESKITTCNIGVDETHEYTLTIKFIDDNTNQDDNRGKRFKTKISVNEYKEYQYIAKLVKGSDFRNTIKSLADNDLSNVINIVVNKDELNNVENKTLISSNDSDYKIYASYDNGTINIYTDQEEIYLNEDSSIMFNGLYNALELDLTHFNASLATNMESAFASTGNGNTIVKIDDSFDTANVTNMKYMFNSSNLSNYDFINNFNMSKVENISAFFHHCYSNGDIYLHDLDLKNVKDASYMFYEANFKSVAFENTSFTNTENLSGMFKYMPNLESVDLGNNFDAESVTSVYGMFNRNPSLRTIDLGNNFNCKSLKQASSLIIYNDSLISVNLGNNFNAENMDDASSLIMSCKNLETLDIGDNFNAINATTVKLLDDTPNVKTIYLGNNFRIGPNVYIWGTFGNSSNLETIYAGPNSYIDIANTNQPLNTYNTTFDKLKGGAGTMFESEKNTAEYFRIDDPENGKPGYFTLDPRYS